jgi:hypothetical protein
MKLKFDAKQFSYAIGTALAMLGAATPFLVHAPLWVGAVCAVAAAGLNYLAHAVHTDDKKDTNA